MLTYSDGDGPASGDFADSRQQSLDSFRRVDAGDHNGKIQ
jgi:hypothetical protein